MTDPMLPNDRSARDEAADARLQQLLHDARAHYNVPRSSPDFAAMWTRVEREAFDGTGSDAAGITPLHRPRAWGRSAFRNYGTWAGLAAGLLIGVLAGRRMLPAGGAVQPAAVVATVEPPAAPVDMETARHLGQTAALLVSLPAEPRGTSLDSTFAMNAQQLLATTRVLLDAAEDPASRALLEDLELVLAQIVGLRAGNRREELELINQAVEQRELLPRLNSAVSANTISAE